MNKFKPKNLNNIHEIYQFIERYKLLYFDQEEQITQIFLYTLKRLNLQVKNLPKKKTTGSDGFTR